MGCSTSKSVEVYSTKVARPEQQQQQQHAVDSNAHLVALTSSTYGFLRLDTQKKTNDEPADDPVNLMYQKMMSLDAPGQSWSEVSSALSQLKSEAQNKATVTRPATRTEPETVDVSELLEHAEEPPPPKVVEQPRGVRKQASQKRDISVIHTLEEVDKLAIVPVLSPDVSESDDDDFQLPYVTRSGQRFSTSTSVRSRPKGGGGGGDLKSSKSLTVVESQNSGSTLFDAEFLESFKEAFEQLSTGVPSTTTAAAAAAAAQTKSTAKGNKIAQLGATKTTPFKPSSGVNVDETKASSPKPVSQRKLKVTDQSSATKVVNDLPEFGKSKLKSKQKNLRQQEPPPEVSNKSAKQQEPPANKLNQQRGPEESNDSPKTRNAEPKNKLNNAQETATTNTKLKEASEMSKASRQKEIPVFTSKKTTVKPSEPALLLQLPRKCPPEGDNKVVLYSTSLRGIRKTFEDCNTVRSIVQSFNVEVDERDVSMDSKYRQELRDLMDKPVAVPRLFIKGRYVGGAEEVVGVHESGGLEKMLHGFPRGNLSKDCDGCGGMRFIPCTDCNGSCKAVSEDGKVIRCPDCNENGLVRCPICS